MDKMIGKKKFKKFKTTLPKNSFVIIIQDSENGPSEFMAYDTTEENKVTDGYVILRGFIELLETQLDKVIVHGQAAIFREVEVNKPEIGNKPIQKGNVTIVDFKK